MNDEDLRTLDLMKKELDQERIRRMGIENDFNNQNSVNLKDLNVIEFQLDLKEELDKIYHLLKGDIIERTEDGGEIWVESKDDRMKILSDYGVKQLMNSIYFYINKNTLLSNYDETTIYWKVRDFGIEIADLMFNRYESFFSYPSPEELFNQMITLISNNIESFEHILIRAPDGQVFIDEYKLYNKCLQWSKEELQSKLRHYPTIIMNLVNSIHSTYLRALNGEERESLRKQMSIIQSLSNNTQQANNPSKFSIIKPSTWK